MPSLLQTALDCAARGWYVFPCLPASKQPATAHGFKDATTDRAQIERWWEKNPKYNVAIACGASNLCIVDIDHGLQQRDGPGTTQERIADARERLELPASSYAVRTGKRSDYGLQIYLEGAERTGKLKIPGAFGEYTGDIKSFGGYVMAAGSIHPDSKEAYEVLDAAPVTRKTEAAMSFRVREPSVALGDDALIEHDRNSWLTRAAGKLRSDGFDADTLRETLHRLNERRMAVPLPEEEVDRIADNASRWELPAEDIEVVVGSKPPVDPDAWRLCFHSRAETEDSPDPQFLIQGFLQEQSITGLIGPARARKSIVTINMIHALLTGQPLFGKLVVANKPERCVYLCPESGLLSLGRRIRNMGLAKYVGESLFYTSMNSEMMELDDPRVREASQGAVLFIDTLVRFFGGAEENSAGDMAKFFSKCQTLLRSGVRAIVILHHTAKNAEGVRLESGRGSGDFGGSLTAAWGTTLEDYDDAYNSLSLLVPVKERDFRAESFKLSPSGDDENFFLQFVEGSENTRVQAGAKKKAGNAKAAAFARANPDMKAPQLRDALAAQGIPYSERTCRDLLRDARAAAGIAGVTASENGGGP